MNNTLCFKTILGLAKDAHTTKRAFYVKHIEEEANNSYHGKFWYFIAGLILRWKK